MNACEVKAHLIECWQNLGAVCFWQPMPSGLNLVVAVLRDSLCVVSLLPCVADCCTLYTVCKVERFVLTIINEDYYYYILLLLLIVQNGDECWCGNTFGRYGQRTATCGIPCPGQQAASCGGDHASDIYSIIGTSCVLYTCLLFFFSSAG